MQLWSVGRGRWWPGCRGSHESRRLERLYDRRLLHRSPPLTVLVMCGVRRRHDQRQRFPLSHRSLCTPRRQIRALQHIHAETPRGQFSSSRDVRFPKVDRRGFPRLFRRSFFACRTVQLLPLPREIEPLQNPLGQRVQLQFR